MRRLALIVLLVAIGAIIAVWLTLNPGSASFSFHGWVVETSFAIVAVFVLLLAFVLAVVWRGTGWLLGLPNQIRRSAARARAQRGYDALERALIASAAGDGGRARRQAARAGELLDRPLLTRVISARAAEAAGELESAEADYRLLLESPETQIVGLRGLAQAALARGDLAEAKRQSATAFSRNPQARWAFETLFDAQTRTAEWAPALVTLAEGERHGHVSEAVGRRRRAVLLTAEATDAEIAGDLEHARERAVTAANACPEFPPAATLAARLLQREGQARKARRVLEEAWRAAPHPALAMRWRELGEPGAGAAERADHMDKLITSAPEHRESRILAAENALARGEAAEADRALAPLTGPRTARLCALSARIAEARSDHESARRLVLEGVGAPGEPDWSDVDPNGPAFAYADDDWARLVFVFGDEGRLTHPRHDRFEPELIAAPELRLLSAPAPPPEPEAGPKPDPKPKPAPEPKPVPDPEPKPDEPKAAAPDAPPQTPPQSPPQAPPVLTPAPADIAEPAGKEPTPPSPDDPGPDAEEDDEESDLEQRFRNWE